MDSCLASDFHHLGLSDILGGGICKAVGLWLPCFLVEVGLSGGWGRSFFLKHAGHLVNSDLSVTLVVSGAHVNKSSIHLVLTGNQDVVPLGNLSVPDFLVNLTLRSVELNFVAELMEVQVYGLAVINSLLRDGADNDLSGREPERPLASQVLNQDSREALN
jgi:hypothetical protein